MIICRFCNEPMKPGLFDSVPGHPQCVLDYLDSQRLSAQPIQPRKPIVTNKPLHKAAGAICDLCGLRCVCTGRSNLAESTT